MKDVPFQLPGLISYEIDLPMPPSVNEIWAMGKRKMYSSSIYAAWKMDADKLLMASRIKPNGTIPGAFTAHVKLSRERRGRKDLDNHSTKAVFDYLQSRAFIANDKNCEQYTVEWTDHANAPWGCRVTVRQACT